MPVYDLLHARSATVAQFDSVPIEDFSRSGASWKTFVNEVDERPSYIHLNVFVGWWIKPYYYINTRPRLFKGWITLSTG